MKTYRIIRFFEKKEYEIIKECVTLKEARKHCKNPETSSRTCTTEEGKKFTEEYGKWFDGYEENKK